MRHLTSTVLRGLSVVLPIAITAWILVWLARGSETLLRPLFVLVLSEKYYLPGLGIALGIAILYGVGVLVQVFVIKRLWEALETLLERIPLVKTIYMAISEFFEFFSRGGRDGAAARVVTVDVGNGAQLIGFVTANGADANKNAESAADRIAVYLPLSYQIGGYTLLIPRDKVTELDLGVEDAMRMVLTAGIGGRGLFGATKATG